MSNRRVRTTSGVRSLRKNYEIEKYCTDNGLHGVYGWAITKAFDGFYGLVDQGQLDVRILGLLCDSLKDRQQIEVDLRSGWTLPPGWDEDETNWDKYRMAIAVTLLQKFYNDQATTTQRED